MKILSIGNSFSQDAQRYLHRLALNEGIQMKTVNLYIGGCSLRRHYLNMLDDNAAYDFQFNGESTGLKVSIHQALVSDNWDYITLQQASHESAKPDSYTPYIEALAAYVRKYCPKAKLLIHQTWAYEDGSVRLANLGYETAKAMFADIEKAYQLCCEATGADGIIPCGKLMMALLDNGIEKVHRDTFHASLGLGRYAQGLLWFRKITGMSVADISYNDFDEEVPAEQIAIAKAVVDSL